MYRAPNPRERERWHALVLARGWSAAQVAEALEQMSRTFLHLTKPSIAAALGLPHVNDGLDQARLPAMRPKRSTGPHNFQYLRVAYPRKGLSGDLSPTSQSVERQG
jgi:hypothetical protein